MEFKQRKRAVNFTATEEEKLINLTIKYKDIMKNKRTDRITRKEKHAQWGKIGKEFNASGTGMFRTIEELRTKYDNMKKAAKLKSTANKKNILQTEGVSGTATEFKLVEENMKSVIEMTVDGLPPGHDSNAAIMETNKNNSEEVGLIIKDSEMDANFESWAIFSKKLLKSSLHPALRKNGIMFNESLHEGIPEPSKELSEAEAEAEAEAELPEPVSFRMAEVKQGPKVFIQVPLRKRHKANREKHEDDFLALCKAKTEFYQTQTRILLDEREFKKKREDEIHKLKIEILRVELETREIENENAILKYTKEM